VKNLFLGKIVGVALLYIAQFYGCIHDSYVQKKGGEINIQKSTYRILRSQNVTGNQTKSTPLRTKFRFDEGPGNPIRIEKKTDPALDHLDATCQPGRTAKSSPSVTAGISPETFAAV